MSVVRVYVSVDSHGCCGRQFRLGDEHSWSGHPSRPGDARDELGIDFHEDHWRVEADAPRLCGTVRRIQVLSRERHLTERGWEAAPGRFRVRDVDVVPRTFDLARSGGTAPRWVENGLLVDVELRD